MEHAQPDEKEPYHSHYLGETMIVDGHGSILARMSYEDGEGVILADVMPGEVRSANEPVPSRFWIAEFTEAITTRWQEAMTVGRKYYEQGTVPHRAKKFPIP
jgi:predicted amidohydrolase